MTNIIKIFFDLFGKIIIILTAQRGIVKLLLLFNWASIFLLGTHFLGELSFDDCKSQVEKEEGTDEDDWIEVDHDPGANRLHESHHYCCPTFH